MQSASNCRSISMALNRNFLFLKGVTFRDCSGSAPSISSCSRIELILHADWRLDDTQSVSGSRLHLQRRPTLCAGGGSRPERQATGGCKQSGCFASQARDLRTDYWYGVHTGWESGRERREDLRSGVGQDLLCADAGLRRRAEAARVYRHFAAGTDRDVASRQQWGCGVQLRPGTAWRTAPR